MADAPGTISALQLRVERWIRPEIVQTGAYHVPSAEGMIKLDAMENPYRWPEDLVDEWLACLRDVSINRYPDPSPEDLKASLREAMGVPEEMDILLGNGSDELIQMMAMAMAKPGRVLLAPEPSFVMYDMIARFTGMEYVGVPLTSDKRKAFKLDEDAMLSAINKHQPALIFLAYPNNPTGNLFERDAIHEVIKACPGLVVLDEAYHGFAGNSFMNELGQYENLVVMRTLSKMGLAGLRLGLLAGPAEWLTEFDKIRLPYNINVLTQASVRFALSHRDILDEQIRQIRIDRESLQQELSTIEGVTVYPSRANFILIKVKKPDAVFDALKEEGVLIKNLSKASASLSGCLRVTVGTTEENEAFLAALKDVLLHISPS